MKIEIIIRICLHVKLNTLTHLAYACFLGKLYEPSQAFFFSCILYGKHQFCIGKGPSMWFM